MQTYLKYTKNRKIGTSVMILKNIILLSLLTKRLTIINYILLKSTEEIKTVHIRKQWIII